MADTYTAHAGTISHMLANLAKVDQKSAAEFEVALIEALNTPDGAKVLILLEKAVLLSQPPLGVDDRALREIHGQRHLVAEIKRIATHGRRVTGNDRRKR